jgi:2-keto-4-pentenoate hydratase
MAQTSVSELADAIAGARHAGGVLPHPFKLDLATGYAVQGHVAPKLGDTAGWKVGATNAVGQAFLKIEEPIRGRVFRAGIHESPAYLVPPGARPCEAEPEIILEAGDQGQPVRAWIGLEIVRPSRDDALSLGAGFIVADNAAHVALVLGSELPLAAVGEATVRLFANGVLAMEGSAAAVLGHPFHALGWLAETGLLRPGELVATGAMCRAVPLAPGDTVIAGFHGIGTVEARWPGTQ